VSTHPTYGPEPLFAGADYIPLRDDRRLLGQFESILALMRDGKWRTLEQISWAAGAPPASASSQLRHMRKPRFGAWDVQKRHLGNGLYAYRVDPASGSPVQLRLARARGND